MSRLTPAQLKHFHNEGYLIIPDVFDPADLEPVRGELHQRIRAIVDRIAGEGRITDKHDDEDFDHQLAKVCADDEKIGVEVIRELEGPGGGGQTGVEMFRTITHPKLLDVIETILGPEIVGSSVYRVRPKIPGKQRGDVPWHQDSGYFAPHSS